MRLRILTWGVALDRWATSRNLNGPTLACIFGKYVFKNSDIGVKNWPKTFKDWHIVWLFSHFLFYIFIFIIEIVTCNNHVILDLSLNLNRLPLKYMGYENIRFLVVSNYQCVQIPKWHKNISII